VGYEPSELRLPHLPGRRQDLHPEASNSRRAIGRWPIISLSAARTEAKRQLAEKTLGKVRPQSVTYAQATKLFIEEKRERRRASTVHALERHLALLDFKSQVADITHDDIERRIKRLSQGEYNHRLAALKGFFNWCMRRRYRTDNPTIGLAPYSRPNRTRVLSDGELKRIWHACSHENEMSENFRIIVRLLILQGFRSAECAGMRTSYIDGTTGTFPPEAVKNNIEFVFPLCSMALDLLHTVEVPSRGSYFFPSRSDPAKFFSGWSKNKTFLDKLSGVSGYTLHDIRRTFRTRLGQLGVMPHIAERLVHHVTAQTEMERIYNHHKYLPEMRAAIELWERYLEEKILCGERPGLFISASES
jgi:integrase